MQYRITNRVGTAGRKLTSTSAVAAGALAMAGVFACSDDPMRPVARAGLGGPRLEVAKVTTRTPWTPPLGSDGYYYIVGTVPAVDVAGNATTKLAAKACDVWIGEDPGPFEGEAPHKFNHQLYVNIDPLKLANGIRLGLPAAGVSFAPTDQPRPFPDGVLQDKVEGSTFVCDAMYPQAPGATTPPVVVMDPITDHPAKGDGPKIFTNGVRLDLNGMSIQADPRYDDNLGIVIAGKDNELTNSLDVTSKLSGFGHNVDVEAENAKVLGKRYATGGYSIETTGGLGVRLSSGQIEVTGVKSVDLSTEVDGTGTIPVGVGFEIRRCQAGSNANIHHNYFVGSGEGVLIRECGGVTIADNIIYSPGGVGVNTRAAVGTTAAPVRIDRNTIDLEYPGQAAIGSTGIAWALGSDNLKIVGNTITNFPKHVPDPGEPAAACGISITSGRQVPDTDALIADNTIEKSASAPQVCGSAALLANVKPVAGFTSSCPDLTCKFTSTSTDADGIASYEWDYGDGTPVDKTTNSAPTHPYLNPGTYQVTLIAIDNRGGRSAPKANPVTTSVSVNNAPTARFDFSQTGFTVNFDGSQSSDPDAGGAVVSYAWDFGDGLKATTTTPKTSHLYAASGTYKLQLTVTDERGKASPAQSYDYKLVSPPITLTVRALSSNGGRRAELQWTAASGANVIIRRQIGTGPLTTLLTTADDGQHVDTGLSKGTYRYQVCSQHDATCSDVTLLSSTVTFR